MTDLKDQIIAAIEDMRQNPPLAVTESGIAYEQVLAAIDLVEDINCRGKSYCGMASDMAMNSLSPQWHIMTATAAPENSCFHHFNIILPADSEMLICDLTVSQFLTKPMHLLGKHPYFVGTPDELKTIIETAAENTWACVQKNFPERKFRTLWDVDLARWQDGPFSIALQNALEKHDSPCLQTESFYHAWDITWGDTMRIRHAPSPLSDAFYKVSRPIALTPGTTAPIDRLVNWRSHEILTRKDTPRI